LKLNNETKVGILAVVALGILYLGFNWLNMDATFVSGFELKTYYENVEGLATGNPVQYNGVTIGTVKRINLDKKEMVEVIFSLDKTDIDIPIDSKAVIASADLLGSKAIRIDRGDNPKNVENGGVLDGEIDKSLEEQVKEILLPVTDDVSELIKQMERFVGWVNNTLDASSSNKIDIILDEFVNTSRNFSRASYGIDTLIGSSRVTVRSTNKILRDLGGQTEKIGEILDNTSRFTDSLSAASSAVVQITESSARMIQSVEGITRDINDGKGTLGKIVKEDSLYNDVEHTIARLDSFLGQIGDDGNIPVRLRFGTPKDQKYRERLEKKKLKEEMRELRKAKKTKEEEEGE